MIFNKMPAKTSLRYLLLSVFLFIISTEIKAQTSDSLIAVFKSVNAAIANLPCNGATAAAITNRAMNVFMADKIGYLSQAEDLSLYTNYVSFNTSDGRIVVNHNFQKVPPGNDERNRQFFGLATVVSVPNNFTANFLDRRFDNGAGLMFSYKWLATIKTRFTNCGVQNRANQKQAMDALRAGILYSLITGIDKKVESFKIALSNLKSTDVPGQNIDSARALMQHNFYEDLQTEYDQKFAEMQAKALTKTHNFKLITTHWTSIDAYLPVVSPKYAVAAALNTAFQNKHSYPANLMIHHTRFWESSKTGRLFLTFSGGILFNNSKLSYELDKINYADYKTLGGTDTLHAPELKHDKAYIGSYRTFVTPLLQCRLVYFPLDSHIGVSFLLEQNFGTYNFMNGRISIPLILINSKKTPAANFEFYVSFSDMNNRLVPVLRPINKTTAGISVGIPFSRIWF